MSQPAPPYLLIHGPLLAGRRRRAALRRPRTAAALRHGVGVQAPVTRFKLKASFSSLGLTFETRRAFKPGSSLHRPATDNSSMPFSAAARLHPAYSQNSRGTLHIGQYSTITGSSGILLVLSFALFIFIPLSLFFLRYLPRVSFTPRALFLSGVYFQSVPARANDDNGRRIT